MTIEANGQTLTTNSVYRTANVKQLPKWQRNRGVILKRTAEMPGFPGPVAIVQPVGERSEFAIAPGLLSRVN